MGPAVPHINGSVRPNTNEFEDGTLVIVRYHLGEEGIEVLVSLGDVVVA